MSAPSKVGLFLGHHKKNRPGLAEYPVVMLHDLGQAHNVWPNFWDKEPWGDYLYGLLPNPFWKSMYDSYPHAERKPKDGVAVLGWPKADVSFQEMARAPQGASPYKGQRLRALYAPSWEYDNQQDKFLRALVDLPVDIYIKQQHWDGMGHLERVQEMAALHRGKWSNVNLLDPKTKIFDALALADCIVSDESSTMVEGFMVGVVPIAIMDWKVPDTHPPRAPSVPFPFIKKVVMAELASTIASLTNPETLRASQAALQQFSDYLPANPGIAAEAFADVLVGLINQAQSPALAAA
jgi:CDP-glycerol glycerophosphotransferase (TagB/SpsB family)